MLGNGTSMEYVTLKQLAEEFGTGRSSLRKWILKNGFGFIRVRTVDSLGQASLAVEPETADAIRSLRNRLGYSGAAPIADDAIINDGVFYAIQLVPEFAPHRIKLGFATDAQTRLSAHQTAAPTAALLKTWPCKRSWEVAAIASITRAGAKAISSEVFDFDTVEGAIERGDAFFAIMPQVRASGA